jgi:hypothetical protein
MLIFVAAVLTYNKDSYFQVVAILLGIVVIVALLSDITEKKRSHLKSFIGKVFFSMSKKQEVEKSSSDIKA